MGDSEYKNNKLDFRDNRDTLNILVGILHLF